MQRRRSPLALRPARLFWARLIWYCIRGEPALNDANLSLLQSEWAGFGPLAPAGWSGRGGQTTSPYYPKVCASPSPVAGVTITKQGSACGSSSGSGVAAAIGLAAATLGPSGCLRTETTTQGIDRNGDCRKYYMPCKLQQRGGRKGHSRPNIANWWYALVCSFAKPIRAKPGTVVPASQHQDTVG
jgi:hypothetical protein